MRSADRASSNRTDVDNLIDGAASWLHRDLDRCVELLDDAETAIKGQRDLGRAARISEIRGEVALHLGELGAASSAFRHARRNWLAVGRRLDAARATLGCTEVQVLLGEYEAAESAVLRVQAQLGREAHEESRVALLDATVQRQLADARAGMGQMTAALRHYETAENLYAALGDADGMALVSLGRGVASLDAGRAHNAMVELQRARSSYRASGQERESVTASIMIAASLAATGQVARALGVLDCLQPHDGASRWQVGIHRLARSQALLRAGLPAEAHAEAGLAEDVFAQIGAVECSARAALACAEASLRWERFEVAAREVAVADRLFAECGSQLLRGRTWLVQAELALARGDLELAAGKCARVLDADLDDVAPFLGVHARLLAARVVEPEHASDLLDAAADLAVGAAVPELRVDVLLARARHLRRLGHSDEALEALRSALGVGRAWEQRLGEDASAVILPSLVEATDELIALLLERNDHAAQIEAWRRARMMKSSSLGPLVEHTHGARPTTDEERAQRLDELLQTSRRPSSWATPDPDDEVLPSVPWGSLVEYYVTGEEVVAFVVRDGQVDARVLGAIAAETRRLVSSWQQECRLMAPESRVIEEGWASPALDGLCELLVKPLADLLADLDDELQVIGHRHLHAVPFEGLLDEVGPWFSALDAPFPSELPPTSPDAPGIAALVLAVPDDNAPLITAEAEMIFTTLPSAQILIGEEATREALIERAPDADVVHLVCHGVFRQDNPLSSALQLGDGWLHARDIISGALDLGGAVVVLSACGSGLSPDYLAEPIGLASACLSAGAEGVIAALWAVDDAVTLELMTSFYRGLAEGLAPPYALRRARREVAAQHPHPYFWAAFRYVGHEARRG
ncbi:CHAT domain-containing protein [Nocardioides sp. MH1]|uniref:CHAT domain-containing protein n=1 Tax=Nocardioides sp. MH1 TaxID=3242490 RepID=UPI00352164D9